MNLGLAAGKSDYGIVIHSNSNVAIHENPDKLDVSGNYSVGNISGSSTSTGSFGSLIVDGVIQFTEIGGELTITDVQNINF